MDSEAGGTLAPPVIVAPAGAKAGPREPFDRWFSIWVAPRATIRQILDTNPRAGVRTLVIAGGVIEALGLPFTRRLTAVVPFPVALQTACAVVLVPLFALIGLYFVGWLLSLTGRWLEGRGDSVAVRAAIAWAYVPRIWSGLLLLPLYILLAGGAYPDQAEDLSGNLLAGLVVGTIGFLEFVVAVWQLVILLKGVGEAHRFSAWRAFGALLLSLLLLGIPVTLLAITAILIS
jgi:hypothetical protein